MLNSYEPMRFAGTWKQYSKKAMPQLTRITFQRAEVRNFKWPYQAKVMKIFEMVRRMMVLMFSQFSLWGEIYSLFPSTIGDYFGSKYATSNNAFLYSSKGVAALIGVYLPAILFEQFGSWTAVFYGSAVLAFLSGLTALILRKTPLPKRLSEQTLVSASGTVIR